MAATTFATRRPRRTRYRVRWEKQYDETSGQFKKRKVREVEYVFDLSTLETVLSGFNAWYNESTQTDPVLYLPRRVGEEGPSVAVTHAGTWDVDDITVDDHDGRLSTVRVALTLEETSWMTVEAATT